MPGNVEVVKREEREVEEGELGIPEMKPPRPRAAVVIVVVAVSV